MPRAHSACSSKVGSPGCGSASWNTAGARLWCSTRSWVRELEHCWRTALVQHPQRTCAVDLTSVTFVDQAGRYLLQLMHRDGARLVASRLLLQDILDHSPDSTD